MNTMIGIMLVVLVAGVVMFAVMSQSSSPKKRKGGGRPRSHGGSGSLDRDLVAQRWATIQAMAAGGGNGLRTAVSEADKLLDYALKLNGARGDTMGDRLKSSNGRFSDINSIWRAHKVRNALAHEVGFDLVASQAHEALRDFERGLRDLGAL